MSWNNWTFTWRIVDLGTHLTLFTKVNSKWMMSVNVKPKNMKLLEDYKGENLDDLGLGDDFLGKTSQAC